MHNATGQLSGEPPKAMVVVVRTTTVVVTIMGVT